MAMSHWDTLSGIAKAGAVVLIVVGTLLLLPVLLMAGFQISMRRLLRQFSDVEEMGYIKVSKVYRVGGVLPGQSEPADSMIIDAVENPKTEEKPKPEEQ